MRASRIAMTVSTTLVLGISVLGMMPPQSKAEGKNVLAAPSPQSALYPIHKVNKIYPLTHGHQSCGRIEFKVNAAGKPEDFRVWSHYLLPNIHHRIDRNWLAPNFFDQFVMDEISKWKFHPRIENGQPIPTTHVIRDYELTSLHNFEFNKKIAQGWEALIWLCSLPPMHGVPIVAAPGTVSKASESVFGVRARDGKSIDLGPDHVLLGLALLPHNHDPGDVWLQLCIDTHGRPRNVTTWGHKFAPGYVLAARRALEPIKFPDFTVSGKQSLVCGLHVRIRFEPRARKTGNIIGLIGPANFKVLTETSSEPKLVSQRPIKLSLSIPPGTKLPPVARVELKLCIEPNGHVSHPAVVQAEPPKLFDQAAIKTVNGWRFEKLPRRMCDVYEWIRFPLRKRTQRDGAKPNGQSRHSSRRGDGRQRI